MNAVNIVMYKIFHETTSFVDKKWMKKADLVSYLSGESTLPGPSSSTAYVSTVEKKKRNCGQCRLSNAKKGLIN